MSQEYTLDALFAILERLRAPDGCPWDREQTRETLSRCLVEECAELLDAIDHNDAPHICEELGDVLMNVVFQAVLAKERNEFDLDLVLKEIIDKMIRRHSHIFGADKAADPAEALKVWEANKAKERAGKSAPESLLDKVPHHLSALNRAEGLQIRAGRVGFDWSDQQGIVDKIDEELAELKEAMADGDEEHVDEELGDLLFICSNLARFRKRKTAEELLRQANLKFEKRFRYIEKQFKANHLELKAANLELMEKFWQEAKGRSL